MKMKARLIAALVLILFTLPCFAGGSTGTDQLVSLLSQQPAVYKALRKSLNFSPAAFAWVRFGDPFPNLEGARMGPYTFEATVKGTEQKVLVAVCTDATFLDAQGHPLAGDAQFHATTVREKLSAVLLLPDTKREQYPPCPGSNWTQQFWAEDKTTSASGVTTDANGDVYVTGYTAGGLDGNTLSGSRDFFVAKYNTMGAKQWIRQLGVANGLTEANGITTDASNNVYVIGDTTGALDGHLLTGIEDFFVTKYNSSGTQEWTREMGVEHAASIASGVTTDASGDVYVAGYTTGGVDGNTLTGKWDFFVTKYSSGGTQEWTREMGVKNGITKAHGIATDTSGNIYVVGDSGGGFDGKTLTGEWHFFVTKYSSSGTQEWTREMGVENKRSEADGVATDASGNFYVINHTMEVSDGKIPMLTNDTYITKCNSGGANLWTQEVRVGGQIPTSDNSVTTDASGNVYVAGTTTEVLDGKTLADTSDSFVTKYGSSGKKQWTRQLGVAGQTTAGIGVATDASDNVYVAGDTTAGLDGNTLSGKGATDLFVTKYNSNGVKQWTRELGASR